MKLLNKGQILIQHCYTMLVYERINKKLKTNFSHQECETLILKVLQGTGIENY